MDQDNLDPLDPVELRDGPVESQDDDGWADDAVEAEPGASKKCIHTRPELKHAGAVVILSRMRRGLNVDLADIVDEAPAVDGIAVAVDGRSLLGDYPTKSGCSKSLGDALGMNSHGFKLRKKGDVFLADANNIQLLFKCKNPGDGGMPKYEHETVAVESGFESMSVLRAWSKTLPEFIR